MYATPVIYPLSQVPQRWQWIAALNPMAPIVEAFRLLLLGVGTVEPLHLLSSMATTVAVTIAGLMLFSRIEKTFVDIV
jgi:lipopolysaccharide transport system permease protein